MLRWTQRLAPFDFKIEYKTGKSNVVADALSRRPDHMNSLLRLCYISYSHYLTSGVDTQQLDDLFTQAIREDSDYATKLMNVPSDLKLHDNKLWHVDENKHATLIVPNSAALHNHIMKHIHASPWAGHLGYTKSL